MKGSTKIVIFTIVIAGALASVAIWQLWEAMTLGFEPPLNSGTITVKWQSGTKFHFIVDTSRELESVKVDDVAYFTHEVGDVYEWHKQEVGPGGNQAFLGAGLATVAVMAIWLGWYFQDAAKRRERRRLNH